MQDYSAKVIDHFLHPRRLGVLSETDITSPEERLVVADAGHITRGDALRVSLRLRAADELIVDIRFQNFGTGLPIASSSCLCSLAAGKTLNQALAITAEDLDRELEGLPELRSRQPVLILDALDAAARKARGQPPRERARAGEPSLCTCFQVPESIIERAIRLRHLKTVPEITAATKAGGGCHTCHPDLEALLERIEKGQYKVHIPLDYYEAASQLYGVPAPSARELANNPPPPVLTQPPGTLPDRTARVSPDGFIYPERSPVAEVAGIKRKGQDIPAKHWKTMNHTERVQRIEDVLEHDLRPAIRSDGGDIKLLELKENRVLVTLHGHCKNCHSALSTLKMGVEKRLQEAVWPELEIEEVFDSGL